MDLVEIGRVGVEWIGLNQDKKNWGALVDAVMKPRVS
jgi:hypothetical protein